MSDLGSPTDTGSNGSSFSDDDDGHTDTAQQQHLVLPDRLASLPLEIQQHVLDDVLPRNLWVEISPPHELYAARGYGPGQVETFHQAARFNRARSQSIMAPQGRMDPFIQDDLEKLWEHNRPWLDRLYWHARQDWYRLYYNIPAPSDYTHNHVARVASVSHGMFNLVVDTLRRRRTPIVLIGPGAPVMRTLPSLIRRTVQESHVLFLLASFMAHDLHSLELFTRNMRNLTTVVLPSVHICINWELADFNSLNLYAGLVNGRPQATNLLARLLADLMPSLRRGGSNLSTAVVYRQVVIENQREALGPFAPSLSVVLGRRLGTRGPRSRTFVVEYQSRHFATVPPVFPASVLVSRVVRPFEQRVQTPPGVDATPALDTTPAALQIAADQVATAAGAYDAWEAIRAQRPARRIVDTARIAYCHPVASTG